jgi:hypothetical protein
MAEGHERVTQKVTSRVVPRTGLEPARDCSRYHLKVVRIPIPPPGRIFLNLPINYNQNNKLFQPSISAPPALSLQPLGGSTSRRSRTLPLLLRLKYTGYGHQHPLLRPRQ